MVTSESKIRHVIPQKFEHFNFHFNAIPWKLDIGCVDSKHITDPLPTIIAVCILLNKTRIAVLRISRTLI